MIAVLLVVAVVVVLFMRRRAKRRAMLAGLNSDKPQFLVPPPTRSLIRREDYRL